MKFQFTFIALLLIAIVGCNSYENDGNAVYYNSWNEGTGSNKHLLNEVNPSKFHVLKFSSYAKDDRQVFYNGDSVKGADAKTFEALGDFFAHDKYRGILRSR